MEVVSCRGGGGSHGDKMGLNPWAEPYVPARSYIAVEDFSAEWWNLVTSSAAFRGYWLRHCFFDADDVDVDVDGVLDALPDDAEDLFYPPPPHEVQEDEQEQQQIKRKEEVSKKGGEVVGWGMDKWWRVHSTPACPRYAEKAPKIISGPRVSPRTIQQPR